VEHNVSAIEIAAALAKLVQGDVPLLMQQPPKKPKEHREDFAPRSDESPKRERKGKRTDTVSGIDMEMYRIEVGHSHGVKPGNIVGAIANETGLDGEHIARIKIEDDYSTVELPSGMPKELFQELKNIRVAGQRLNISKLSDHSGKSSTEVKKAAKSKKRMSSTSKKGKSASQD